MIRFFSISKHSLIWQNSRFYWVLNEQLWFWSDAWQAGEREADADLKAGRYTTYDTAEEFLAALDEEIEETI